MLVLPYWLCRLNGRPVTVPIWTRRVAHEQWQWAQAEQYYRQALHIHLEFADRQSAAITYHQLGRLLAELQRHAEVVAYVQAACLWRAEHGVWPEDTLEEVRKQRPHLSPVQFQQILTDNTRPELRQSMIELFG